MLFQHGQTGASELADEAPDPRSARLAARASIDFFLRTLDLLTEHVNQDILASVIIVAIRLANVSHGSREADPDTDASAIDAFGTEQTLKPISISALSRSLNLPFETVRRHVMKLVDTGWCERVPNGIIISALRQETPQSDAYIAGNTASLQQLANDLGRIAARGGDRGA